MMWGLPRRCDAYYILLHFIDSPPLSAIVALRNYKPMARGFGIFGLDWENQIWGQQGRSFWLAVTNP